MISAGEKTGNLFFAFKKIADFYDESITRSIEDITSLIEPIIMIFIGITIGILIIAIYLPIFEMAKGL